MPIWNAFLDRYGQGWEAFAYDVRVGPGSGAARDADLQTQAVFETLTKLRIDAVGYREGEITVFEVKPYAGISTVGQLVGYRALYIEDFRPGEPVRVAVVTDRFQPAVGEVFRMEGIEVWLV